MSACQLATYEPLMVAHQPNRESLRVDLDVEVSFESEHNFYTGFTENISGGGLFVATHAVRPVGSMLRVKFTLPTLRDPIETSAIVRWIRETGEVHQFGMGLQFIQLSESARKAVNDFISQRETIFYDAE